MYLWDEIKSKYSMADIDITKLVIYRSNIEDEDIDAAKEALEDEYPDETILDSEVAQRACDDNALWLDDERTNLDIPLNGEVIAIAKLGLWDGSRIGYQRLGFNVNGILRPHRDGHDVFYGDAENEEVLCDNPHHDGTNRIRFREMKEGADVEEFLGLIYNQKVTEEDIQEYTRSLYPYVAKEYGWPLKEEA